MFYPVDSLRRGGRFYLCWVADSWPLRFATITHRQLSSQDIRKICDDLIEVMTNESGRPSNRFSLRLSSQLMRGLVRIYQRKVTIFLSDLCMINANVIKHANKKFNVHDVLNLPHRERPLAQLEEMPRVIVTEEPENEERVEEMIQNSGNVVANVQDITLKEATIPDFQLPPNDGFGEENPSHLHIAERTLELMLAGESAPAHSGLGPAALDITDTSHDKSRLAQLHPQMERISDQNVSLFRSEGAGVLPAADFEKEIPEIPDIPIPELPVPQEKEKQQETTVEVPTEIPTIREPQETAPRESEQIILEELEEIEPQPKRRRIRGLIIDKTIKISGNVLRSRIKNPYVELRCENSSEDIIALTVPGDVYMRRASRAGAAARSNFSLTLTRMFMRNLGVVNRPTTVDKELQEEIMHRSRVYSKSTLGRIEEVEEPANGQEMPPPQPETAPETSILNQDYLVQPQDLTDTEQLLVRSMKRKSEFEDMPCPKRQRSMGYVSFRETQQKQLEATETTLEGEKELHIPAITIELEKENVPPNISARESAMFEERNVTALLKEAGLADIGAPLAMQGAPAADTSPHRKQHGSESSETPLGSLDRTKVSLGDSDKTTDSKRFIRDQWGTEGTMKKIMKLIKQGLQPVTVKNLIDKGPIIPGHKAIIAARCFTSILKLKHYSFIKIVKCPDTLEIMDIKLDTKCY